MHSCVVLHGRWHSCRTFDVRTKTGGPFGTIRFPEELSQFVNNGLEIAVRLLDPIKQQFPILSYADFYQVFIFIFSLNIKFIYLQWILSYSFFGEVWDSIEYIKNISLISCVIMFDRIIIHKYVKNHLFIYIFKIFI